MSEQEDNNNTPAPAEVTTPTPPPNAPEGSKQDKNGVWRNALGHILPGQVCNPKGRGTDKKAREFRDLAQSRSTDVLDVLYLIVMNAEEKANDRIKAGDIILDRAYGKPTPITQTEDDTYVPRPIIIGNIDQLIQEDQNIVRAGEEISEEEDSGVATDNES